MALPRPTPLNKVIIEKLNIMGNDRIKAVRETFRNMERMKRYKGTPTFIHKKAGVVDRTVEELNNLQWGYRHMRNPYAEANSSSRNTNYVNDYFAKQSGVLQKYRMVKNTEKEDLKKKLGTNDPKVLWHAHLNNELKKKAARGNKDKINEWTLKHPYTVSAMLAANAAIQTPFLLNEIKRGGKVTRSVAKSILGSLWAAPVALPIIARYKMKHNLPPYANIKEAARVRDIDPRNKAIQKGQERGALIGTGAGVATGILSSTKRKPVFAALGATAGFLAGKEIGKGVTKAYQDTRPAPVGSHNIHKRAEVYLGPEMEKKRLFGLLKGRKARAMTDDRGEFVRIMNSLYTKGYRPTDKKELPVHYTGKKNTQQFLTAYLAKKAELEKIAIIRKQNDGFHIYSHSGKHLGGPYSEEHAKKRLSQIEFFKKHAAFLDKHPKIQKFIRAVATAGALATATPASPAKAGGIMEAASKATVGKTLESTNPAMPALELRQSKAIYHKPESIEAKKYVADAGLEGPHWVVSDTARTKLAPHVEKRDIETFYFPQESGDTMREATKETVNLKRPDMRGRESWLKPIDYDEAKAYLEKKKVQK